MADHPAALPLSVVVFKLAVVHPGAGVNVVHTAAVTGSVIPAVGETRSNSEAVKDGVVRAFDHVINVVGAVRESGQIVSA